MTTSLLGAQSYWCSACSALGVLVLGRSGTQFCDRPLSMLGAGSVPVLGVLCACRTRWSTAPALRCRMFHRIRRSASPGNQPLWFSGARQRWPWAAPVLGRFLAWPSRRVVTHSPQPLRHSVAICRSDSAASIIFLNPSRGEWHFILFLFFSRMLQQTIVCHFSGGMVLLPAVSINTLHRMENEKPKSKVFFTDNCRCRV